MASGTKKIERRLGYFAFARFQKSFQRKSPNQAEAAGARLGKFLYRVDKKHRMTALSNLALAFPEMPEEERIVLAKRCFEHFGRIFGDFLRSPLRKSEEVLASCDIIDFHHFDEALAAGHGVLLITGHFGNWERAAHILSASGLKLSVVARDANDGDLAKAITEIRHQQGVEVLARGQAARGILSALKRNEVVGILPDQNSGDIFIPFFGKPAGTVTGPSSIAVKTGAKMIPFFCYWVSPGRYEARAYPPLVPEEGYEPVEGYTRAINRCLENVIREHPEQWLWFHNRWKSAKRAGLL
jgi:KDO2-lipid IV(A) lauroyltransferase